MPHPVLLAVTVLAVLVVLTVAALLPLLRLRLIAHGRGLLLCAARPSGAGPWRLFLGRYADRSLELFAVRGMGVRPSRRLARGLGDLLGVGDPLPREQWPPSLQDPVVLRWRSLDGPLDLAVDRATYPAVRSWIESSPPSSRSLAG